MCAETVARRAAALREFSSRYGGAPTWVARAGGRVNLIGEHTDYNDGFVLPMAIEAEVRLLLRPRSDSLIRCHSLDFGEAEFDLNAPAETVAGWARCLYGMGTLLREEGLPVTGLEAVIQGTVPRGAGLSSSAATMVACGMALLAAGGGELPGERLAQLAQEAEARFLGVRCGIMDPFVSRLGRRDHALLIDCRTFAWRPVPLGGDCCYVVADSRHSRELAVSAYNQRRAECESAVRKLAAVLPGVRALRDVSPDELREHGRRLDEAERRRARHVVLENRRVEDAVRCLERGAMEEFGRLMNASHESLRDDYEVSSPALDALVATARSMPGCLGSRLTGAGFGGCTVSLVRREAASTFVEELPGRVEAGFGFRPHCFETGAAEGAWARAFREEDELG